MKKIDKLNDLKKKILSLFELTGCVKEMGCSLDQEHVHQYVTKEGLKKYILGEKEHVGRFYWTDTYTTDSEIINNICKNNLCIVDENIEYINQVISNYTAKREAYIHNYIYGPYVGCGYGYNASTGNYGYESGLIYGYHYEYAWKEISLDEYVVEQVRDYTYEFKFYKIDENGNLISKNFKSLEDVEKEYKYFINNDFVQEYISDSYYLNKEDIKKKTLEN